MSSLNKAAYLPIFSILVLVNLSACAPDDENSDLDATNTARPRVALARIYSPDIPVNETKAGVSVVQQAVNGGHGLIYQVGQVNGRVMSGMVNMYYIWYGSWSGNSAQTILGDFGNNISNSPYYNINTMYDDAYGGVVSGAVQLAGVTTDNYSQGTNLSLNQVWAVVANALQQNRLPIDPNGVYFVLTSADVSQDSGNGHGFCSDDCGWHSYNTYSGNILKYAFVGNGDRCPMSCRPYPGPNGNAGADGMVSVVAHELEEAVTDPQIATWVNSNGMENADLCAWNFGTGYVAPNGAMANMHLGNRDYYIQQNWINTGSGSCGLRLPFPTTTDCLFNWAEANYQSLFSPAGATTVVAGNYLARYYSGTQSYLGISLTDQHVYYLGSSGSLQDLGLSADWLVTSHCQSH